MTSFIEEIFLAVTDENVGGDYSLLTHKLCSGSDGIL